MWLQHVMYRYFPRKRSRLGILRESNPLLLHFSKHTPD